MPDTPARLEFLKKIHLFRGLSDEQVTSVAKELKENTYSDADTVFLQGAPADSLYFVYQGRVTITRLEKKKEIKLGALIKGDYFGEQGLLTGHTRNATIKAEKGTILLALRRDQMKQLLRKAPGLRPNLEIMIKSRELANQLRFKWLSDNEVIYMIVRKHTVLLYQSLFLPIVLLILPFGILWLALVMPALNTTLGIVGGLGLLLDLAWAYWKYVDWGNDYYIVTNQRVVWLEKVIGLYDSRNEANTSSILSVSIETNEFGRMFGYGTVVVRTFSGQIRMEYIPSPHQAAAMVEEYWMRTKESGKQSEEEAIKEAIRKRLGMSRPKPPAPPAPPAKPKKGPALLQDFLSNAFKMRLEASGVVSYRKHVYVLFRDTWIHNTVFLILFAAPFLWGMIFPGDLPPLWFFGVLSLGFLIDLAMWIYEYMDWSNDLYQVTAEQIIDVSRRPFGDENRKAAPLENILSSEYKRRGLAGMLFNFGTVFIMVGGAQFNFEDVADPPSVQQDVVRRQQARLQKKRESETAGERDRLAEWLAMYHRTVEEIQREQEQAKPKNPE